MTEKGPRHEPGTPEGPLTEEQRRAVANAVMKMRFHVRGLEHALADLEEALGVRRTEGET